MKTCPEHSNQTVVFDTKIYTVVSEVSIRFEENYQQIFKKQSCRDFLKSISFKKFWKFQTEDQWHFSKTCRLGTYWNLLWHCLQILLKVLVIIIFGKRKKWFKKYFDPFFRNVVSKTFADARNQSTVQIFIQSYFSRLMSQ